MSEIELDAIQEGQTIQCPKVKFGRIWARKCEACGHYQGLAQVSNAQEFEKRYRIICQFPIARAVEPMVD